MRKFFTFVILAVMAVSAWGTEVSVTIPESEATTTQDFPFTISHPNGSLTTRVYQSKTQQIFLASEIGATNAGTIKSISFKSSTYATTHSDFSDTRRKLTVYMQETELSSLSSFVDYSEASQIFSAEHFEITSGKTFSFNNFEFNWSGTKNILITVIDNTEQAVTTTQNNRTFVGYTPSTNGRGIAQTFEVSSYPGPYTEPTVLNTIARITFTIDASGSTTPSISTSTDALNFGSFYPAGETVSQTFTVTASNLTKDITLATTANGVTINPTSISKDNTALAGDGVEVTVTLGSGYTFTSGTKLSITSDGASTKEIALKATEVRDDDFSKPIAITYFKPDNSDVQSKNGYVFYSAKLTISEVANNQFKPYNSATFKVDYSGVNIACAEAGKVSNLRGKFISNDVFKAFSFDYEAPELSAIVINENEDNSDKWPEAAQSGKELLITRTIVPNEWNSIVLPTDLTSTEVTNDFGSGTDVEEFTGAVVSSSNITLLFTKKTDGIVAGVPYLIKPTQALPNPLHLTNHSFTPTASTITKDGIEFAGVLVPTLMDATGDDFIFVGSGNTLLHPSSAGTIKGMRAYFHVVGEAAKAAIKKSPMISLSTGSTTAMTLVKPANEKSFKAIENGRIVINVQGKKIDVLGQTVK